MKFEQSKQMQSIRDRQFAILSNGTIGDVWFEDELLNSPKSMHKKTAQRAKLIEN